MTKKYSRPKPPKKPARPPFTNVGSANKQMKEEEMSETAKVVDAAVNDRAFEVVDVVAQILSGKARDVVQARMNLSKETETPSEDNPKE